MGLSFFALTIGILVLTLLLAILSGLRERSRLLVREIGANVIAALPLRDGGADGRGLTEGHALMLERSLEGCRVSTIRRDEVTVPGLERAVTVIGTDESLAAVRGWDVREGRFLDRWDLAHGERHVVASRTLCNQLRIGLGGEMSLGGEPFTVVGITDTLGGGVEGEAVDARLMTGEGVVFVPRTAPAPWIAGAREEARRADAIFVQVPQHQDIARVVPVAERVIEGDSTRMRAVSWVTPDILLRGVRRLQRTVQVAGGSIALLCLVLGGTTLMSLMVANVRDRIVEIGLRRALGASRSEVAQLFVLEACLVTGAAGLVGLGAGQVLLAIVRHRFGVGLAIGGWAMALPLLAAVLVGATFAYWPARQAARISPAEALRNE